MYATPANSLFTTSDLAATLTDVAFEAAVRRGASGDSVETELALWHRLHVELDREPSSSHLASNVNRHAPIDGELRTIVCRAVTSVAG